MISRPFADNAFEENDSCTSAWPLAYGVCANLHSKDADPEFYLFVVEPCEGVWLHMLTESGPNQAVRN
jgi:hypothetical protein